MPNNPVLLQASYREAYLNSQALQVLGISETATKDAAVVRDTAGKPTGRVLEAGFRQLVAKLPTHQRAEVEASTRLMITDLNKAGLTTFGSAGCEADVLPIYQQWARKDKLNVRVCSASRSPGGQGTNSCRGSRR